MVIYSKGDLYNKYVQEQASEAFLTKNISEEAYKSILAAYPSKLYTPNYFIRITLGVLTLVAIAFFGLFAGMLFARSAQEGLMVLFFFLFLVSYTSLELLVKQNHYYNAGVDNLLLFFSAVFAASSVLVKDYASQNIVASGVAMLVCLVLAIRFADSFMAVLGYIALFVFIFLLYIKLGSIAKVTVPFLMMVVSGLVYLFAKKLSGDEKLVVYKFCCKAVMLLTLLTFYASANYFVVKELSNEMFKLNSNGPLPFGWLFWMLTFVIPFAYVAYGIWKKDLMFIRTGLVLIAATVFTYRYYYAVIPGEMAMLLAGALLVSISYLLIKYLKRPKHKFSFSNNIPVHKERVDLEALIIAEVAGKQTNVDKGTEFGGGRFGGGGAGGNY